MKVILTKDVKGQGKSGDVINVSDGYANNFLIKKGLAVLANNENMNVLNNKIKAEEHRKEVELENAKETDKKLSGKEVTISSKAGEGGKLFGAVTSIDIADAIEKDLKVKVDKRKIVMKDNIKSVGVYEVEIKIHKDVISKIKVNIKESR